MTAATGPSSWRPMKASARRKRRRRFIGADGADAAGKLQRSQHGDPQPVHESGVPGQHHSRGQISAQALRVIEYYPLANRPGTASNLVANGAEHRRDRSVSNARRSEHREQSPPLRPLQLAGSSSISSIGAIPVAGGGGPNTNYNTLVAYTHTLTSNRLVNDFRVGYHSVYDDSLNYFAMNGITDAGAAFGIPGFDGDVRYDNPGIPLFTVTGFSGFGGGGTNWYQFDRTFQFSNVLAYTTGVAQHPDRLRCAAPRDRTPRREQPTRVVHVQRRDDRLRGGRLHARAAAHGDDARSTSFRATSADGATGSSSTTTGRSRET